jgi:hypothetical protein
MPQNNDMRQGLQDLLGGSKNLDPLEQTVFEKGPQAGFTPPEVANVYQEGRTIFPSSEVRVSSSGADWYKLGQFAFDTALRTYTGVVDYLIDTKRNGIVDAKDVAQSKLYDIETQISAETYNANQEKRPRHEDKINELTKAAQEIKSEYSAHVGKVLGEDYSTFMDENLDMNTLGLKYQNLALTARGNQRDIDRTTNRMVYELERVTKQKKEEQKRNAGWALAGTERTKENLSAIQLGLAPVPVGQDGVPLFFAERNANGSWAPKVAYNGDVAEPALKQGEDGNWYFNISAVDATTDWRDIEGLVKADGQSHSLISVPAAQVTESTEKMLVNAAESNQSNTGTLAYAGMVLKQVPDHVASNIVQKLPGLNETQRMKLMMLRSYAQKGLPIEDITAVGNMRWDKLKLSVDSLNRIAASTGSTIQGNANSTEELEQLNFTGSVAGAVINTLTGTNEIAPDTFMFEKAGDRTGFVQAGSPNMRLSAVLQQNPGLAPEIARVIAVLNDNKALYSDPNTGVVDANERDKVLATILKEQINNNGWVNMGPQLDGTPVYIYQPGLSDIGKVETEWLSDASKTKAWPDEVRKKFREDPSYRRTVIAQSALVSTDISNMVRSPDDVGALDRVTEAAQSISPTTDVELLRRVYTASHPVMLNQRDGNQYRMSVGTPTMRDIAIFSVACTPAVLANKLGVTVQQLPSIDSNRKLAAVKEVIDDFPAYSADKKQLFPGVGVDYDIGPGSFNYLTASNGGIPLAITQLKGTSGTDYMAIVDSASGRRSNGRVVPRNKDGTPSLMIKSVYMNKDGMQHQGELRTNLKRVSAAIGGDYDMSFASTGDEPASYYRGSESPSVKNVIYATTEPYLPQQAIATFGNKLIDKPLTDAETAITGLRQMHQAFDDAVQSDPELKNVHNLIYEFTRTDRSAQKNNNTRDLFSDENLTLLYNQAVANGAKTQSDFAGFVFGAMRTYYNNPVALRERDFEAQRSLGVSSSVDVVSEGPQKGRILLKYTSNKFFDTVMDKVKTGDVVYTGPAPEDNDKLAFYTYSPDELTPELRKQLADNGYTVAADATMLQRMEESPQGQMQKIRKEAEEARNILYPPKAPVQDSRFLSRQSTLPSDQMAGYQKAWTEFYAQQDIYDMLDVPFIDLAKYYADNGKMPPSMDAIPEKYILPGHSSTMRWVDRLNRRDSFGRRNELTSNVKGAVKTMESWKQQASPEDNTITYPEETSKAEGKMVVNLLIDAVKYPLGVLAGFTKTVDNSLQKASEKDWLEDSKKQVAAQQKIAKLEELIYGKPKPSALAEAGSQVKGLAGSVDAALQKASEKDWLEDARKQVLEQHRQAQLEEYKKNPYMWVTKMFDGDDITKLRQSPPNSDSVKVPEKAFDMIHMVTALKPEFVKDTGINEGNWTKLRSVDWSPVETEYQLRLQLKNTPNYIEDLNTTIQEMDTTVFQLDPTFTQGFAESLYKAYKQIDNPITREEALVLAQTSGFRPDLKRAYFNLRLHPEGYASRPRMTAGQSIIDALAEQLK